jgi:hypothetical protein
MNGTASMSIQFCAQKKESGPRMERLGARSETPYRKNRAHRFNPATIARNAAVTAANQLRLTPK